MNNQKTVLDVLLLAGARRGRDVFRPVSPGHQPDAGLFRPAYGAHDAEASGCCLCWPSSCGFTASARPQSPGHDAGGIWPAGGQIYLEDGKINFKWKAKHKNWVGIGLVIVGIYLLWNSVLSWLNWILPDIFGYLFRRLPQVVIGVIIIWLGIKPITGKKQELDEEETCGRERRRDRLHRHPGVPQRVHRS